MQYLCHITLLTFQFVETTRIKHNKEWTICIFLGIYCNKFFSQCLYYITSITSKFGVVINFKRWALAADSGRPLEAMIKQITTGKALCKTQIIPIYMIKTQGHMRQWHQISQVAVSPLKICQLFTCAVYLFCFCSQLICFIWFIQDTKFSGWLSEEQFPWLIQKFPCILIFKTGQPGCQLNLSKGKIRLDLMSGQPLV